MATRCTSPDQFVEAFARFCEGRTLFVSSLSTRPIGTRLPFVILLADGARAMRGQCEVIESYANPGNVYRRPGVKLSLTELDDESEAMLARLQQARAARDARTTGLHQAVSAAGVELQTESRAALEKPLPSVPPPRAPGAGPVPAPPPPKPPAPPRPPPGAGGKIPALPPLPRLERPEARKPEPPPAPAPSDEPHWLAAAAAPTAVPHVVEDADSRRGMERAELPVRPSSAALPPPPTDAADDGWGDDERAGRSTPMPAMAEPPAAPAEEDSSPAVIVAAAPDHAAAADVAAAGDAVESVPVVELINRSRRESAREYSRPNTASGRVSSRMSAVRSTPGDVYSGEERTPGSSFILPANPLSNLTDEALQGFVDLTIYEDDSQPDPALSDPAISGSRLGLVEDPEPEPDFRPYAPTPEPGHAAPRRSLRMAASGELAVPPPDRDLSPVSTPIELVHKRPPSQPLASVDDEEDEDDLLPPATDPGRSPVAASPVAPVAPPPVAPRRNTPPPIVPERRPRTTPPPAAPARAHRPTPPPPTPRPHRPTPPPPLPLPPPPTAPSTSRPDWMSPAASDPAGKRVAVPRQGTKPPPKKKNRWLLPTVIVIAGLAAAAVLLLRYRDRVAQREAGVGSGRRDPVVAIDAGVAPPIDAAALAVTDAAVAPPIDAAVASPGCHLTMTSTPSGAAVTLDRRSLGETPIDADVPCGRAVISARLAKYSPWSKEVTLVAGKPGVVRARLSRPMNKVTIISSPRPAVVFLDGKRVGVTNMELLIEAGTKHALTIEREGYQTFKTTVTADEPEKTVAVPLVKLP